MSIRAIALELYRAQQKLSELETKLEQAPLGEKEAIRQELREAQAEWQMLRKILDGEKSPSPFKSKPSTFKIDR
jgi:5-bromo-4-chloroindolyl phosphate hydrolysis protein